MTDHELDGLARRVGEALAARGLWLATAESCTGGGLTMSKKRKSATATACQSSPGGVNSSTSQIATISSQTMPPWSGTPSARPVRCAPAEAPTAE